MEYIWIFNGSAKITPKIHQTLALLLLLLAFLNCDACFVEDHQEIVLTFGLKMSKFKKRHSISSFDNKIMHVF